MAAADAARVAYVRAVRLGLGEPEAFKLACDIYAIARPDLRRDRLRGEVALLVIVAALESAQGERQSPDGDGSSEPPE